MDGETFYDEEIAPVLMELARKCEERGISLVSVCQYSDDGSGSTFALNGTLQPHIRLTNYAAQAKGNADALILALVCDAEKHGHGSVFLNQLGVKATEQSGVAAIRVIR